MNSEILLQIAQLATIVVGFLGVAVTLRSHRRQMDAQMFLEFSSRFHDVLRDLPAQIWTGRSGDNEPVLPVCEEFTKSCMRCFLVAAGIHYLHESGFISRRLWLPFQAGIKRTMRGAAMQREWLTVEEAFHHNPRFCQYMKGLIESGR